MATGMQVVSAAEMPQWTGWEENSACPQCGSTLFEMAEDKDHGVIPVIEQCGMASDDLGVLYEQPVCSMCGFRGTASFF